MNLLVPRGRATWVTALRPRIFLTTGKFQSGEAHISINQLSEKSEALGREESVLSSQQDSTGRMCKHPCMISS